MKSARPYFCRCDWTDRYPRIHEAMASLRTGSAVVDGEAVWCDGDGLAIFDKLHSRAYDGEVILYAFDLLELYGQGWRPRTLEGAQGEARQASRQGAGRDSTSRATALRSSPSQAGSGAQSAYSVYCCGAGPAICDCTFGCNFFRVLHCL